MTTEINLDHCPSCAHRYGTKCGCPCCATELDPVAAAWLAAARAAKTEITRLEETVKHAVDHVQAAMGDAEDATINGRPAITWAWSKPGKRLDRKALEADHGPEFVAKYLVENTPARPFRILDPS